jgi:hypothetical protein
MTTDHLDGEIRRAVQELGDAAGVPPMFDDIGTVDVGPRRRPARWSLALALATAAAVIGVAFVARPDGASPPTGPTGIGSVAASVTVGTSTPAPVPTDQEQAILDLVEPALPEGFAAVYVSTRPSLRVVVYDRNFARVDLWIALGEGEQMRRTLAPELHPVAGGAATADGLMIVTALDDVISATTSSAPNDSESPPEEVDRAAADLVADVAVALDPAARERLRGGTQPVVGAGELREQVADIMEERTGWTITGSGGGSAGELVMWVTPRESGVGAGTVALTAFHTALRLPDAITRTDAQRVTATRWVAGWQLVVTAFATEADPAPATEDELASLLDALSPAFTEWRPEVITAPVCGTYTFGPSDDAGIIADRFGITLDDLIEVNPDVADSAMPGDQISVPCGATQQVRSFDAAGLEAFTSQPIPAGETFEAGSSVTVASDRFVWIVTGGTNTAAQHGAVRVERFDRATGAARADRPFAAALGITPCAGPIEVLDDPTAPLAAIPARCVADGRTGTVDVWSAALAGFAG